LQLMHEGDNMDSPWAEHSRRSRPHGRTEKATTSNGDGQPCSALTTRERVALGGLGHKLGVRWDQAPTGSCGSHRGDARACRRGWPRIDLHLESMSLCL
jgi:hypothetical protein